MSSLRIVINPSKKSTEPSFCKELIDLQEQNGFKNAADVGKLMAKKLGTNPKSETTLYNFFRRGERAISKSRIPVLAEIFGVDEEVLSKIKSLHRKTLQISCDPKLPFRDYLQNIPSDVATLDSFLIWLSTESQRRVLMSNI